MSTTDNPGGKDRVAPLPLSRLALNLITVGTGHTLERVLDACVAHGVSQVSPWQDHYAPIGVERAARLLQERSISVNTLCRMSGFGGADSSQGWQRALDDAHRLIDEAAVLRASSITVIGGGLPSGGGSITDARKRIFAGIEQVLPAARDAGVMLAIEPLHPVVAAERGAINTIAQAESVATQLGEGAAVMIDAYNTWWDPALAESIARARGRIGGFQLSDWLVPTTDLAFDRGMMGDGVIELRRFREMVEDADYDGPVEVEILSKNWSERSVDDVISTVVQRFCDVC